MANRQLPDFLTAENDLDGQEPVYIAQGGKTRKTLLSKIKEFIIGTTELTTTDKSISGAIEEVKEIADKNTASLKENTQNIANKIDKSKVVTNLAVTETGFLLDALTVVNKFKTVDSKLQEQTSINIYLDFNQMEDGWTAVNTNVSCANAPKTTLGILFQKTIGGSGVSILQLFFNTDGTKQMRIKWYGTWSAWN